LDILVLNNIDIQSLLLASTCLHWHQHLSLQASSRPVCLWVLGQTARSSLAYSRTLKP